MERLDLEHERAWRHALHGIAGDDSHHVGDRRRLGQRVTPGQGHDRRGPLEIGGGSG